MPSTPPPTSPPQPPAQGGASDLIPAGPADGFGEETGGVIRWARVGWFAGPVLFVLVLALPTPGGLSVAGQRVAATAALMAVWWMTEAIPLAATALLPMVLFPLMGIMSAAQSTAPFADDIIYLFFGGFCIALSMQRWDLHRRIALFVVNVVGTQPRRLVLGFMIATAFISAWMSNTATTVMMLPIAIAVLAVIETDPRGKLGTALLLSVAYAASIGGMATLIGTPPNAVLAASAEKLAGRSIGFVEWMYVGAPLAVVELTLCWWLLVRVVFRLPARSAAGTAAGDVIRRERTGLGPMKVGELTTAVIFGLTALAWILREPKVLGAVTVPGIASWFPAVRDSTIAIAGALALFILPVSLERRIFTLDWAWATKLPWDVLLLIGGGLVLANGFLASGLSVWIGQGVTVFASLPTLVVIMLLAAMFCALTELTSNTATATMAMPVMAGVAAGTGMHPLLLMATAALASSSAYMLPVSTPPNAIVFGSGRVTVAQMIRAGFRMEIISVLVISLTVYYVFTAVFGIPR